jgi:hypothetical protein
VTHEYGESINAEAIERAVAMALKLSTEAPAVALEVQVDKAIRLAFCACVIDDEDAVEQGLSGTHAAMIVEVTRRVERARGAEATASGPIYRGGGADGF